MKIAVVGGTGMLGRPVVEEALHHGHTVRVIGRDEQKIRRTFDARVDARALNAQTAPADEAARALEGCDTLHISLAGYGSKINYHMVQSVSVQNLVAAATSGGVRYITYLSGATVAHPSANEFYDNAGKKAAEEAIERGEVPYRIFRPSWFVESLPLFVRGKTIVMIGKPKHPQAWLTAAEYARIVVETHVEKPTSGAVWIGGPETLSIPEAVERYASAHRLKVRHMTIGLARLLSRMGGGTELRHAADLMDYFSRVPDQPNAGPLQITTETGFHAWLKGTTA